MRLVILSLILALASPAAAIQAQSAIPANEKYRSVAADLESFIMLQLREHRIPAISIALVDDQQVVWAKGFGLQRLSDSVQATAETVHRVGSVSKLFTDIGVMQLVEKGVLDLDAPVTRYLPNFRPAIPAGAGEPWRKPITLRQLMSHRSGLLREPPVGNYFETTEPSLARTIASLNNTELVYAPESRTKYSSAAIATVGFVVERTQEEPFAKYLKRSVLDPLGLERSSFEPSAEITKDLAKAYMWTVDGRGY